MASLVRSTVLRQCLLRHLLPKSQHRTLSVLVASQLSSNSQPSKQTRFKNELSQVNQFKRHKSFVSRKILYTRDELIEKVMAISKKHEKVDETKVSRFNSSFLEQILVVFGFNLIFFV